MLVSLPKHAFLTRGLHHDIGTFHTQRTFANIDSLNMFEWLSCCKCLTMITALWDRKGCLDQNMTGMI